MTSVLCIFVTRNYKQFRIVPFFHRYKNSVQQACQPSSVIVPICPVNLRFSMANAHSDRLGCFSWNRSWSQSYDKLNWKQLSCFAFTTRNMGQNTAKCLSPLIKQLKTAKNSHIKKSPYNALQTQYLAQAMIQFSTKDINVLRQQVFFEIEGW